MSTRQEFVNRVQQLDTEQLKALFEQLKQDNKTPLGMLYFVSKTYGEKLSGTTKYSKAMK